MSVPIAVNQQTVNQLSAGLENNVRRFLEVQSKIQTRRTQSYALLKANTKNKNGLDGIAWCAQNEKKVLDLASVSRKNAVKLFRSYKTALEQELNTQPQLRTAYNQITVIVNWLEIDVQLVFSRILSRIANELSFIQNPTTNAFSRLSGDEIEDLRVLTTVETSRGAISPMIENISLLARAHATAVNSIGRDVSAEVGMGMLGLGVGPLAVGAIKDSYPALMAGMLLGPVILCFLTHAVRYASALISAWGDEVHKLQQT